MHMARIPMHSLAAAGLGLILTASPVSATPLPDMAQVPPIADTVAPRHAEDAFGAIIRVQSKTTGQQQSTGAGGQRSRPAASNQNGGPSGKRYIYLNPRETDKISGALGGALRTCSPEIIERRYRIDCIRFYFRQIADELPQTGEYAPVREALARAADQLDAIVRQNGDPTAPAVRPRLNGKPAAPRLPPIRALRPGTEVRAERAAQAVIDEAATVLLRSTENSERRMAHYQQIAMAIRSTKVLLRSA